MSYVPSLPENAVLLDVFQAFPRTAVPLLDYHQELMRGDSPLTVGERELIAAYVSALNACQYCQGVHRATAEVFGVATDVVDELVRDVGEAPIDDRMKPLLRYVRKLTETPSQLSDADVAAVFHAGWNERALHDAVSVCALFNFMNRYVDGLGITADYDYFRLASQRLSARGYAGLRELLRDSQVRSESADSPHQEESS